MFFFTSFMIFIPNLFSSLKGKWVTVLGTEVNFFGSEILRVFYKLKKNSFYFMTVVAMQGAAIV